MISSSSALPARRTLFFTFGENEGGVTFDCGAQLPSVTLAYQTWGKLNADCSNAILIFHALSGDSHVTGRHAEDGRSGWWELMAGPGRAFDTDRYFLICANVPGGCKGSTGPASIDPQTGKPYGLRFPMVTIEDMVRCQQRLVEHLGIKRLLAVTGGSMGGMQALAYARLFPDKAAGIIPVATSGRLSPQAIAWNEIGRRAIMNDSCWHHGDYYEHEHGPVEGLAIARMVGHVTYLSEAAMAAKFARRRQFAPDPAYSFDLEFEVESYLSYQGRSFHQRFDANSYLYITRALDYFDFAAETGDLTAAFAATSARYLLLSYSSDWLYPPIQSRELADAAEAAGRDLSYIEIETSAGHDSFLLEEEPQSALVREFLGELENRGAV